MLPPPQYILERVNGILWRSEDGTGLTLAPLDAPPDVQIIAQGEIVLRYGIEILETTLAIIPGLFISEKGGVKVGVEAWNWLWTKFQLYARAEVIGFRSDGKPEQLFLRTLDFSSPVRVLAYADDRLDQKPLAARITILHAQSELPKWLGQYLKDRA